MEQNFVKLFQYGRLFINMINRNKELIIQVTILIIVYMATGEIIYIKVGRIIYTIIHKVIDYIKVLKAKDNK